MKPLRFDTRLLIGFLVVAVLPLAGIAWFHLASFEQALTGTVLRNIASIADKKADQINNFIDERLADVRTYSRRTLVREAIDDVGRAFRRGGLAAADAAPQRYARDLKALLESAPYYDLLLIDAAGNIVFSIAREADLGTHLGTGPYRDSSLAAAWRNAVQSMQIDLTPFHAYEPSGGKAASFLVAPVFADERLAGALALQLNVDVFTGVVADRTGLGDTGETVMAVQEGGEALFTAPLLRAPDAAFRLRTPMSELARPLRHALSGEYGKGIAKDYSGAEIAAAWRYMPALHWGMVVKIDTAEAFAPAAPARRLAWGGLAFFLLFSATAAALFGRKLSRADQEIRLSNAQLAEAQRIAGVSSWTLDLRNNRLEWSDEIFRIFELDPKTHVPSYEAFLDAIHPEDREAVRTAYAESLAKRTPYEITHRLTFPDGRVKFVHERCETVYDGENGPPLLSRGTVQDITTGEHARQALRLYADIFARSGEAIMVTDAENRIVSVNNAFTRLTGYAFEDVRGRNPRVLASGRTPPDVYQEMWTALVTTGFWQGELWDRRKDGSIYPKWAAISLIRDDDGKIAHHIASFTDISERKAVEEQIHRLAHHDVLTGLFNRFALQERLEQALLSAQRDGHELAMMFIDMDKFKLINDTLGHQVGDELLIEVAHRLQSCVRESDIVARLGGDEFVVVLTGVESGMAAGASIAGKILRRLGEPYRIAHHELHSSPSIGLSIYPSDGDSAEVLMKNADTAMYHAKEQGRNNHQFFTAAMNEAASERLRLEQELRAALAEGQFVLHYQPQVRAHDGRVCGVEALVRWQHPERGLVPPMKFIAVAEEMGLIEALGAWVLDEACRQLSAWKAEGVDGVRMAVNLSAHQLRSPQLLQQVRDVMARHGIAADELELEVTESVAMTDPERAIGQLKALRDLGVALAIDDFGTGYSSLSYLKLLPIHALKLDRSFVRDIESDENDAAISAATLALARNLGLKVVAEGVETEGQRAFLVAHRCDCLQGYLFGKPEPGAAVRARLPLTAPRPAPSEQGTR